MFVFLYLTHSPATLTLAFCFPMTVCYLADFNCPHKHDSLLISVLTWRSVSCSISTSVISNLFTSNSFNALFFFLVCLSPWPFVLLLMFVVMLPPDQHFLTNNQIHVRINSLNSCYWQYILTICCWTFNDSWAPRHC